MNTVASLPAKWREELAEEVSVADVGYNHAKKGCADELEAALSTPEQPGSAVRGEVGPFPELLEEDETLYIRRERSFGFSVDDCRRLDALRFSTMRNGEHITSEDAVSFARAILTEFHTTPPPAPAAEQRDREADRRRFTDHGFNNWLDEGISDCGHTVWSAVGDVQAAWQGWEARALYGAPLERLDEEPPCGCNLDYRGQHIYVCPYGRTTFGLHDTQPEARGVEGMVPGIVRCLRWLARTADPEDASEAEAWAAKLEALATHNPVRAEQPEGKGDDPGRMAIRLLVAAGHVTEVKANEALCIAHGFEPGPLAPAAPVGVDAYEKGWINAAKWAQRVDLISDIGSAAYERDKTAALAGKAQEESNGN